MHNPAIMGGEPIVSGTRVPVRTIVILYRLYGDLARVQAAYPHLERVDLLEALAYYEANKHEVDGYIAEDEDTGDW